MKYKFDTRKYKPYEQYEYWEAIISRGSDPQLLKFMKALISCNGKLHQSYAFAHDLYYFNEQSIVTKIEIPVRAKEEFENISGIELRRFGEVRLS